VDATQSRLRLKSIYSTEHGLEEFVDGDVRGLVLVFLGTECPVARQYVPRLKQLHAEYRPQHISFVGVFSDTGVDVLRMATYAHDEDIPFPVVQDVDHRLADMFDVQGTPEVVVLDKELQKKYQGAIDDQFQRHGRGPRQASITSSMSPLFARVKPVRAQCAHGCAGRGVPQRSLVADLLRT
jgi:thiol-disulfide isomerase/thioredoxin